MDERGLVRAVKCIPVDRFDGGLGPTILVLKIVMIKGLVIGSAEVGVKLAVDDEVVKV